MEKKYKKCPYCLEKIRIDAVKCRYCEEWLDKEKPSEAKAKPSKFKKIKSLIARIILWSLVFCLWFIYTVSTVDKSEEAYQHTSENGPMFSGYSIFILGLILTLLLRKIIFNKGKKILNLITRVVVSFIIIIGLILQIDYDPTLSKLRDYYDKEQTLIIPSQHQQERFNYLEFLNLETKLNKANIETTVELKNNSYIYDMTNVTVRFDFFEDEGKEKLIESTWSNIEKIPSREKVNLHSSIENKNKVKTWYVYVVTENTTLISK